MCGIVGYITTKDKLYRAEKQHFLRFALALDTLRGNDSTGLMVVHGKSSPVVNKTTMPGDRWVHSKQFKDRYVDGWCAVGHNRASTVGASTLKNAHPFQDGPITLVHNGTLWGGGHGLPKYNKALEVDSAQIAHNFAEHDPEDAKSVIEEIDGSYCIVWYDERDQSLNMCRNHERPMSFTVNKDKDVMWFMSDPEHLRNINKSFQGRSTAHGNCVYKLETNKILKWKSGSLVPEVTAFSPFSYADRNKRIAKVNKTSERHSSATTSSQTALEKATSKWKMELENRSGAHKPTAGSDVPRVKLGGALRKVPSPMLEALKKEYDLTPHDLLQFSMDASTRYGSDNMVWGTINYPEWGDSEWRAVVIGVKTVQINAYTTDDWVVQPVGICHPWDDNSDTPAILCTLLHCDWKGYSKRVEEREKELEAQEVGKATAPAVTTPTEDSEELETTWVVGPDRELMPYGKLEPYLDRGCVSCGADLTLTELEKCIWVNNHQDILCKSCIQDFHKAAPYN